MTECEHCGADRPTQAEALAALDRKAQVLWWQAEIRRIGLPETLVEFDLDSERYLLKTWLPIPPNKP